jgi:dephospho-CoA kinase
MVVDADRVAHEVLAAGTPETAQIAERFGPDVLGPDGAVNRPALGAIVFADPQALQDLEAITHPGTRQRIYERLDAAPNVAVLEAIKLLEGPLVHHVSTVWVVIAPRELRIERLLSSRGMSRADAEQRIDAQNPEAEKVSRAAVVLVNDGSLDSLRRQVDAAWSAVPGVSERS